MIRALRHRNYLLFFFGQGVSLIGTWMQTLALPWLVYLKTGSVVDLGTVTFAGQILTFVMAPVAGALADRWNRHRLVVLAQVLATIQAAALAALTFTGVIEFWHIILLSLLGGFIRGFEIPVRQSFVVQMVEDKADLPNAIALNSFLVNGSRLIGPALAGAIIVGFQHFAGNGTDVSGPGLLEQAPADVAVAGAAGASVFGVGMCFLLNAVSYLAVIAALLAMKVPPLQREHEPRHVLVELREGLRYAAGSPPIRTMLVLLTVIGLVGAPYTTLLPVFAKDILHGDARTYGFLVAATGAGAVMGALFLASRRSVVGIVRVVAIASGIFGTGLVAFSLSANFYSERRPPRLGGLRHDDGNRRHQHLPPDHCRRGQARPGDEPLHDGLHGHGAVRRPDCRRRRPRHRRRLDGLHRRMGLHRRRHRLCHPPAAPAAVRPADLHPPRPPDRPHRPQRHAPHHAAGYRHGLTKMC